MGEIKFNFNTPGSTQITTVSNVKDAQSLICDANGQLLLYYDGISVFDKNDMIISTNSIFAPAINSIIFKKIGCNNQYYLFETKTRKKPLQGALQSEHLTPKLYYSSFTIANDGIISIVDNNIPIIDASIYSGLTCYVDHENQKVWVIVRNGNRIFSIEVNERGLESIIENEVSDPEIFENFAGQFGNRVRVIYNTNNEIKLSSDGKKLITFFQNNYSISSSFEVLSENGYIQIYDFDVFSGVINNEIRINKEGTETEIFSPYIGQIDGDILYSLVTTKIIPFGLPPEQHLYQYDLTSSDIKATEKSIFSKLLTNITSVQKGPDGVIYLTTFSGNNKNTFIGKIEDSKVEVLFDTSSYLVGRIPSFPQSYFKSDFFVSNLCFGELAEFKSDLIETPASFRWSFGDGNYSNLQAPTHIYQSSGDFTVSLEVVDTEGLFFSYIKKITIEDELISTTLPEEVYICSNDTLIELDAGHFESFLWSTGETTRKILVNEPGEYSVIVSSKDCCMGILRTTVIENQAPVINDIFYDEFENSVVIDAYGDEPLKYILDQTREQFNNTFNQLTYGSHKVDVIDINGCSTSRAFEIQLAIPEYFSPNGDGVNDYFRIPQLNNNVDFEFKIFDRSRRLLKIFKNEKVNWDGKFKNQQLPPDDYWYFLRISDQTFKGHFSLLY